MYRTHLLGIAALTILSGCGGNNEQANTSDTPQALTLPNFTGINVSTAPLEKVTTRQFSTHLKIGLVFSDQPTRERRQRSGQSQVRRQLLIHRRQSK
jgi:hypothetical protein